MNTLVINEMRAWRKRMLALGLDARIVQNKPRGTHEQVAVAYDPKSKRTKMLVVMKGESK